MHGRHALPLLHVEEGDLPAAAALGHDGGRLGKALGDEGAVAPQHRERLRRRRRGAALEARRAHAVLGRHPAAAPLGARLDRLRLADGRLHAGQRGVALVDALGGERCQIGLGGRRVAAVGGALVVLTDPQRAADGVDDLARVLAQLEPRKLLARHLDLDALRVHRQVRVAPAYMPRTCHAREGCTCACVHGVHARAVCSTPRPRGSACGTTRAPPPRCAAPTRPFARAPAAARGRGARSPSRSN